MDNGMVNIPEITSNGVVAGDELAPPSKKMKIVKEEPMEQSPQTSFNNHGNGEENSQNGISNSADTESANASSTKTPTLEVKPSLQTSPETFSSTPLNIPKISDLTESTPSPAAENKSGDDDVFSSLLEWKDGIATLPGSNLKFKMTEYGTLEIISTVETDKGEVEWSTETGHQTSSAQNHNRKNQVEDSAFTDPKELLKGPPPSGICCCEVCGKYGLPEEFCSSGRFCSLRCVGVHTGRQNKGREFIRNTKVVNGKFIKRKKKGKGKKLTIVKHRGEGKALDDDDLEHLKSKSPSGYKKRGHILKTSHTSMNNIPQEELDYLKVADYNERPFVWSEYLEKTQSTAASEDAFKEKATGEDLASVVKDFKKDMKLEAVDPKHPSYICVVTVSEVKGTRLRLHFDGWSESYDFWTYANSPFIFPVHWCAQNGQNLNPPRGQDKNRFNWDEYLKATNALPAPAHLFQKLPTTSTHGFKIGMKLEAVDRQNPDLICVSTVTNVIGERFLVHFDEWDDTYDYWCEADCPYIHPVGWCQENGRRLTPPNEEDIFTWADYLASTGAEAARPAMFQKKTPASFKKGEKLEAVDRRNPSLIRVATVASVQDYNIKIRFDGWDDLYDDVLDADSDDLHRVGWCEATSHPLEPPLTQREKDNTIACPTPGCKGIGHVKGAKYSTHHSTFGCPYSLQNLSKGSSLVDRLASNSMTEDSDWWSAAKKASSVKGVPKSKMSAALDMSKFDDYLPSSSPMGSPSPVVEKFNLRQRHSIPSYAKGDYENLPRPIKPKPASVSDTSGLMDFSKSSIISTRSSSRHHVMPSQKAEVGVQVEFEDKAIQHIAPYTIHFSPFIGINHGNYNANGENGHMSAKAMEREKILKWSVGDVVAHIEGLGCPEQAKIFGEQSIDGEAFLLLNQSDIVNIMKIKLGPALKIYNSISSFLS